MSSTRRHHALACFAFATQHSNLLSCLCSGSDLFLNTRSSNFRSGLYLHLRFNMLWCLGSVGPSFQESTSPDQIWARRVHPVHAGSNSRSATFRIWIWSQAPGDSVPAPKLVNLYCHISLVGQPGRWSGPNGEALIWKEMAIDHS